MIYSNTNTTYSGSIAKANKETLLGGFLGGFFSDACLSRIAMQSNTIVLDGSKAIKQIYDYTNIAKSEIIPEFGEAPAEQISADGRSFTYKVFAKNVPISIEAVINTGGVAAIAAGNAVGIAHTKAMEERAWTLQIAPVASGAVETIANYTPSGALTTASMGTIDAEKMSIQYISKTLARMNAAGIPKMPNGRYAIVMSHGAYYDLSGADSTVFATRKLTRDVVSNANSASFDDPLTPVDTILGADIYVTRFAPTITGASNQATKYNASRVLFLGSQSLCKTVPLDRPELGDELRIKAGMDFRVKATDLGNAASLIARELTDFYVYNPKALYGGYVSDVSLG